jgi:hypothetical protein
MTATMVHDGQPVRDRFKNIDDNAELGIMKGKLASTVPGRSALYFHLERVTN